MSAQPSLSWLRAVASDRRITVLHRLILVRLGLHRRDDSGYGAVAGEIGVDRVGVLGAIDAGRRRGWLLADPRHSGLRFSFPTQDRPLLPAAPSTTPRRAP
jgi:hypothetical protein